MFLRSLFISARTELDFSEASRSAPRSTVPMAGISRSMMYLGTALS
jgi:hypothetical protein